VRLWLFGKGDQRVTRRQFFRSLVRSVKGGGWDANLTAQCYWCGKRFIVKDEWIGQEIDCPLDGCGKPLKLNPFVCDPSDRLR